MRRDLTAFVLVCLVGPWGAAFAADSPDAKAAKAACEAGQMDGCARLGRLYRDGKGVKQDVKKAAGLFKKACDANELPACRELAPMYSDGEGVDRDGARALALWQKLCDAGDGDACVQVAEDDPGRAAAALEQACNAGIGTACHSGGLAYSRGSGGATRDVARAVALYQKGCDGGNLPACYNAGVALAEGKDVVAKDPARSAALFAKVCEAPADESLEDFEKLQPTACYNLAIQHQRGEGVKSDMTRARELFEIACKGGVSEGCQGAESAKTLEKHPEEAAAGARGGIAVYMMKSCDDGEAFACRQLAEMYLTGTDWLPKNPALAPGYFKRANTMNTAHCDKGGKGASMACMELSRAYAAGSGLKSDAARAAALVKKANGHSQAECDKGALDECVTLGLNHRWGIGLPQDAARARALFEKACGGGEQSGCTQAAELDKKP